jgi:hypothetical protein
MHIWQKRGLRTLFSTAFLLVLTFGSGMSVPAAKAASVVVVSDNFEGNPASRWWLESGGYWGYGDFWNTPSLAHSPSRNAYLDAINGWAAVGRNVYLPLTTPYSKWRCNASFWITPQENARSKVNLEVIDPTNWTYIALGTFTREYNGGYQYISIDFVPTRKDVVVRLAVVHSYYDSTSGSIRVDDLYVRCQDY